MKAADGFFILDRLNPELSSNIFSFTKQ